MHLCSQLIKLPPVKAVMESLQKAGVTYTVFDNVAIEPTNERLVPLFSESKTMLDVLNSDAQLI